MTAPAVPFSFSDHDKYVTALRDSVVTGKAGSDPFGSYPAGYQRAVRLKAGVQGIMLIDMTPERRREFLASMLNEPLRRGISAKELSATRDRAVVAAARQHKVPPLLMLAVSHYENTRGIPGVVGPYGEVGVTQVNPQVWAKQTPGRLDDLQVNAAMGAKILRHYYDRYGSWEMAVRAYNGSPRSRESEAYFNHIRQVLRTMHTPEGYRRGWTVSFPPDLEALGLKRLPQEVVETLGQ